MKTPIIRWILACALCGLLYRYALPLQAQVAIITHKSVPSPTQEISALADILTLNTKNWSDGKKITVVDYKSDTPSRTRFYAALGMSAGEMQKVWLRKQFSGKATPPVLLSSEDEVLMRVAATQGAVACISADKVNSTVKVLATIKWQGNKQFLTKSPLQLFSKPPCASVSAAKSNSQLPQLFLLSFCLSSYIFHFAKPKRWSEVSATR